MNINDITAWRIIERIRAEEAKHLPFFLERFSGACTWCYMPPKLHTRVQSLPSTGYVVNWLNCDVVSWMKPGDASCLLLIGPEEAGDITLNKALGFLSIMPGQAYIDRDGHLLGGEDWEKIKGVLIRMDFELGD